MTAAYNFVLFFVVVMLRVSMTSCRPTGRSKTLSFTHKISFLFFLPFINPPRSASAVDGHQMYFGDLVISKASTIGTEILQIFTAGQKVWNFALFSTSLNFEPPAFENAARYLNSETKVQCCDDRPMFSPSLVMLSPHTSVSHAPPSKIALRNVLNHW